MLDIFGSHSGRTCDGVTRRGFLRIGALGMAGLSMADVLKARAAQGGSSRDTAVIQVFLSGGPTHIDTYDPKPDAPKEIRGEFKGVDTAIPGVQVCDLMPEHARLLDKMAIVRSLHHDTPDHNQGSHWIMTGYGATQNFLLSNERPSVGSIVAKLRGSNGAGMPPYVALPRNPSFGSAAYLGAGYNPFSVNGDPTTNVNVRNLQPPGGLTLDRLDDRRHLLDSLDRIERSRDTSGLMDGLDHFTEQAYEMVTGPSARKAFNLANEDPRLRDRYGRTPLGQSCLLARRLVESGVTFVTISDFDNWDHHGQIFSQCRKQLPRLDSAISTLVDDLHQRGLADRVLVLVWGEFGRTPRISNGGRDHWPGAMSALIAGGGLKMGQVVGATNRKGEAPSERPVRPEDLLQTVYHVLGIDPETSFLNDAGRPMPVLNRGQVIEELLS